MMSWSSGPDAAKAFPVDVLVADLIRYLSER